MRSIVLDNYIDRMVEQLSADMKESRVKLVAERKGLCTVSSEYHTEIVVLVYAWMLA